ncbi:MAG: O-acetyl-ADP-ribose deacetylase [Clostridiales bacterium]|nr:O-acetyl-ADP-ribose deacetylase [Clostridiales bacterium]
MDNRIRVIKADITSLDCECIVNAANKTLLGGGGVDGAIHRAAGPGLVKECRGLNECETGQAKITGGYDLKAKHVIHTVGPVYSGKSEDGVKLANCYRNSLDLARRNDLHSIAFSAISTGVYGYPPQEATEIALMAVKEWIYANSDYDIEIIMCCYNDRLYNIYLEKIQCM